VRPGEAASLAAYRTAAVVARALPARAATSLAGTAAVAVSRAMAGRRRVVARNLRRVLGPAPSDADIDREVARAFRSYGRYWAEAFRLPGTPPAAVEATMTYEGVEHLDAAMAAGKGAIMALPHLGNWDHGGAWLGTQGHRITVVVEALRPPALFDWFVALRRDLGMDVVALGPDVGSVLLRTLRANQLVGLVCDRDIAGGGIEVEFFGERTTLPAGPATLALRTGAPILPTAVYLEPGGRHHGVIRPPVPAVRAGRPRDDIARTTQELACALEDLIRLDPAQWHVFQPNWPSDRA
jgi:KDO2-lipid IV(A) lauroyltransferase